MTNYLRNGAFLAVILGVFFQLYLKEVLFIVIGVGRQMQSIDEFPYRCRRLVHKQLEGCEDLWLDDEERVLYAACSGSIARTQWNQAMGKLNISARRPQGSELMALNIDSPGPDGFFDLRKITPENYVGALGDKLLDLVGFDVEIVDSSTLRFWLINQRPPVDENGKLLDAQKIGANFTIDVFELKRGKRTMRHIKTVADPDIYSPNNIALLGEGKFVVTNDYSGKVGLRKEFDPLLGGGNVAFCPASGACHLATPKNLIFPNGLTRGADGLVYVPSSFSDAILVMELQKDNKLKLIETIKLGMPVDNLSIDAKGDIYAAGMPKLLEFVGTLDDPFGKVAPSTVWRISRGKEGFVKEKIVEDGEMRVLSGVTTARHDVKTGRLFMGAAVSPYLMVCDPK
ncbi:hypothetical protein G7Y89_g8324 [Cudoniella acicularis]|uniref:SMP-30/Gluconolactonase/LRE-like region domain-containing protein n=1 Tax=Cudoniella acicularis TaxID=354080 RepID=A0A8H4W0Q0_9HELO|nr:hypothetical protein G7Y89_g8324 [Cudoniella acicularis]